LDHPSKGQILFFYGDGGEGKSLLLRYLRDKYCKKISRTTWQKINNLSDDEFLQQVRDLDETVPHSFIDFAIPGRGDNQPRDPFFALVMMRKQLNAYGLKFPLFDFASFWYLKSTVGLSKERISSLFPAEESDFFISLLETVTAIPGLGLAKATFNLANKKLGFLKEGWFEDHLKKRKISADQAAEIQELDAETELLRRLPWYFAQDLNATLADSSSAERNTQVVLFFDGHETLWGDKRRDFDAVRDEWLRWLIRSLDRTGGAVVVIAGREQPSWSQVSSHKFKIDRTELDLVHLEGIGPTDAVRYVEMAGVSDAEMRDAILSFVVTKKAHPLYLGMCVDVALELQAQHISDKNVFKTAAESGDVGREVIDRFLKYADPEVVNATKALAACRSFDFEVFEQLGVDRKFASTRAAFEHLISFSFVQKTDERYRVHALLQHFFNSSRDEETMAAHKFLIGWLGQKSLGGDVEATAGAVFHHNKLDHARGVNNWVETFVDAHNSIDYPLMSALLAVLPELTVETASQRASLWRCEASYLQKQAQFEEAKIVLDLALQEYQSIQEGDGEYASAQRGISDIYRSLAELQVELGQLSQASELIAKSVAALSEFEKENGDVAMVEAMARHTYHIRGRVLTFLNRPSDAEEAFRKALTYFQVNDPKGSQTLAHKGHVYRELAQVVCEQNQPEAAIKELNLALALIKRAAELDQDEVRHANSLGNIYSMLAENTALIGDLERAVELLGAAVSTYNLFLEKNEDDVLALSNIGLALLIRASMEASLGLVEDAHEDLKKSVRSFDKAVLLAPDFLKAVEHRQNATAFLQEIEEALAAG